MRMLSGLLMMLLALAMCPAGGCNTIEGAGQDIEKLGETTSRVARENNPYREEETPTGNPYD